MSGFGSYKALGAELFCRLWRPGVEAALSACVCSVTHHFLALLSMMWSSLWPTLYHTMVNILIELAAAPNAIKKLLAWSIYFKILNSIFTKQNRGNSGDTNIFGGCTAHDMTQAGSNKLISEASGYRKWRGGCMQSDSVRHYRPRNWSWY